MKFNNTFSLCLCLLLFTCSHAQTSTSKKPAGQLSTNGIIEHLKTDVPRLMKQSEVPGMSIAFIRNAKIMTANYYGVTNADTKQPVTGQTIFEAASLSKIVTAYAALKLVDEGKLNLDTPLNTYLGNNYDVAGGDDRINLITARRVLSHSAGFPNWRPDEAGKLPINFTPGAKFSYSGEGFVYLSKVMEKITSMNFEAYIQKAVFDPLQMKSSSFSWKESFKPLKIYRHNFLGEVSFRWEGQGYNAAASLHTTLEDYSRFVIALLNGTGLKKATWEDMFTPQIKVNEAVYPQLAWGLGVGLEIMPEGKFFWHWGDQGDSKCYVTAQLNTKDAVLYFTNSSNGLSFTDEILHDVFTGKHPAVDWLDYGKYNPAVKTFYTAIVDKGAATALKDYTAQRGQDEKNRIPESTINTIGYILMRQQKLDDAIEVFKQNTVDFPQSSNTWDSLAEAYMNKGNKELAIKYYEKSLELDPGNTNAVEQLKKLRTQ